jgi:hypothetical protein
LLPTFHSSDQLRQRHAQPHGHIEQSQYLTLGLGPFETLNGVYVDSSRVRERLLSQVPREAAVPNLITELFEDGS